MEELGMEEDARESSRAFVLRSRVSSLGGLFSKDVLGAIWKEGRHERRNVDMKGGMKEGRSCLEVSLDRRVST